MKGKEKNIEGLASISNWVTCGACITNQRSKK